MLTQTGERIMRNMEKQTANSPNVQQELTSPHERAILASIADGLIFSDVEGQVTWLNQAAIRILGITPQTAFGHPIHMLFESFPARGPSSVIETIDRLYADPYTDRQDKESAETIIAVGTQVIQTRLSPVLTEAGEFLGILAMLRDITREVEAERARSELIHDVSHELGAPLTAIKGYSEMLLRQVSGRLGEQQENFLRIIQRNADRLVALVHDLLDISRILNNQLELDMGPVQMDTILRDVADVIQPQCGQRGLHLAVEVESNVGLVLGDKNRLTQVITNLAHNACNRTPGGGHITLALTRSEGAVQVDITDTGVGIPLEEQTKIFQRFYRLNVPTTPHIEGTGLELPIARMLIEMHGGRIWMESKPGQGNAFTFILPLHDTAGDGARPPETRHTILVVEDDDDLAQLIALQLEQEGYEVLTTERGEEALRLARNRDIDLITLDIMLPDITGMDVLRRLKADSETADIPVIVVSVLQPEDSTSGTRIVDHITKPFALERLTDSVRRTLATA
jgi:PAS domain S-box-containing protein